VHILLVFLLGTQEIAFPSRNSTVITFVWDTTGSVKGNYAVWAYAWPVPGETDTADNTFTNGWILVTLPETLTATTLLTLKTR